MIWRRSLTWTPGDRNWRTAVLFMVGATLFALGSFPLYVGVVDGRVLGVTFFVGSLFFTSAAYEQFVQTINSNGNSGDSGGDASEARVRRFAWEPHRTEWWATFVQLVGTVFFNVSTAAATVTTFTVTQQERLVWRPDVFGSIAFLIASHLAWWLVCRGWWAVRTADSTWWIAALNYVGSIFFMIAALAAYVLPTTGDVVNIALVNLGTFLGAVCFFVGAYFLLPPAGSPRSA